MEIVTSEENYVKDLSMIVDVSLLSLLVTSNQPQLFMVPMSLANKLSDKQVDTIFSNIESILCIHYEIANSLSKINKSDLIQVTTCFKEKVFTLYNSNQSSFS